MDPRASGRTTRLIDEAIQTLFKNGTVTAVDHFYGVPGDDPDEANRRASRLMYHRMKIRLIREHGPYQFVFNEEKRTIKLKA